MEDFVCVWGVWVCIHIHMEARSWHQVFLSDFQTYFQTKKWAWKSTIELSYVFNELYRFTYLHLPSAENIDVCHYSWLVSKIETEDSNSGIHASPVNTPMIEPVPQT